jgi:hypothetical protein
MSDESNSDHESSRLSSTIKLIRKKYDPIRDGDRIIRFEDNPVEYRKARKYIEIHSEKYRIG